jgi:hypothetical protein
MVSHFQILITEWLAEKQAGFSKQSMGFNMDSGKPEQYLMAGRNMHDE